jgi:hypothetical protein
VQSLTSRLWPQPTKIQDNKVLAQIDFAQLAELSVRDYTFFVKRDSHLYVRCRLPARIHHMEATRLSQRVLISRARASL